MTIGNIPRRNIDTTAVIRWVRMFRNATDPDAANDADYLNLGFNGTDLVAVDNLGTVYPIGGGGGAPTDATYITQTPNGTLTNEQALSALATGLLKSTTVTGVLSIAVLNTDYANTDSNCRVAVNKNSGAVVGTRRRINFIEGSNVTLTIADDAGNEEVDVTIAASGGGSALTVEEQDGNPTVANVTTIKVSNGTLTDDGGGTVSIDTSGAGGGAPADATYIVQTPNGSLSNEQALSALATGIVKNTTTTGVLSIAAAGTDYSAPLNVREVDGTPNVNPVTVINLPNGTLTDNTGGSVTYKPILVLILNPTSFTGSVDPYGSTAMASAGQNRRMSAVIPTGYTTILKCRLRMVITGASGNEQGDFYIGADAINEVAGANVVQSLNQSIPLLANGDIHEVDLDSLAATLTIAEGDSLGIRFAFDRIAVGTIEYMSAEVWLQ